MRPIIRFFKHGKTNQVLAPRDERGNFLVPTYRDIITYGGDEYLVGYTHWNLDLKTSIVMANYVPPAPESEEVQR